MKLFLDPDKQNCISFDESVFKTSVLFSDEKEVLLLPIFNFFVKEVSEEQLMLDGSKIKKYKLVAPQGSVMDPLVDHYNSN